MRRVVPPYLAALLLIALLPGVVAAAPSPGFVTVMFGRMQWSTTFQCDPVPNTVTLGQAKQALDARGIDATGIVITDRHQETGINCFNGYTTHVGWDTIEQWHADGWSFVSGGTHRDMTSLTHAQQVEESCGSLTGFASRGIDATGMFAYGGNRYTTEIQTDPVSTCFEFGRRYGGGPNERATTTAPWFAKVHSVTGGKCNDASLPCYTAQHVSNFRYHSPAQMVANVQRASDTWYAVQFYRFVEGAYQSGNLAWDCTSADWRAHFTSHDELYCYNDYLTVIDALEDAMANGVVATDPETVANAWGRSVDGGPPDTIPPSVTITSPADGGTVPRATRITISASATDAVGVTRIVTKVDGALVCSVAASASSCRWRVPRTRNAAYSIVVTARDAAGNVGRDSARVRAT